ncbi:glycoside hydrolase family 172 protein [Fimbriimonas ginsengisoli]|uniref:DUF2961 domain-containing protein n=1 Tax=Fimbriimonas ginsengisoli Gsoil 348 TaxID=661478 RepID=A0A068NYD7_FIMGI|nr:glycoside hydrolase family 172 protein [Fimbriimonas ginsengisoli]AIE86884.1 hypothetical protein OP10G_3516 [Fimbriimonas ginsengisoli Gsoil 348]
MSPLISLLLSFASASQTDASWAVGSDQLRLDLLPAFKRTVKIGAVTSYDRTEGNDDGFSGKYSFVRKEGDSLVLADLKGPGCIYRIHTPTPTDDPLEFYFDGEATPRISLPFRELFSGKFPPFVRPLVDSAGGGYYCYVPIPYRKSCKVVLRAKQMQFYDLNYATYPESAPVASYDPAAGRRDLARVAEVFSRSRERDLTDVNVPQGTRLQRQTFDRVLRPGKSVTLFESRRPGRIASLRIGPSDAFAGKNRDVLLRITWDGEKQPAVLCPAGDFFGYGWGKPAAGSALVGTYQGVNYCNLPMPFDRSAKVELVSLGDRSISVRGEVVVGDTPRGRNEGKFYAVWRRENPTTEGKPFTFLDTKGRGHIVGLALQAQGMEPGGTPFFEGDDQTTVDGELVVHGTGSEDFFNGGWYDVPGRWDASFARALSGCITYQRPLGRTGGYRFFLGDAYSFEKSILQTIEHAPERNQLPADYCSVTYLYAENRPTVDFGIPSLAMRQVVDPSKVIFPADWTLPINSFSFRDATVSRRSVPAGNGSVRCLSLRTLGEDWFGPAFISLGCDLPSAGRYRIYIDAVKGPEQAKAQLFQDESPVGDPVDLFAEKPAVASHVLVGEINAVEGRNNLMFKLVGKNPLATGFGFDLMTVVCEKV